MATPEARPLKIWRVIDANLNRTGEGLRVLEDLARLVLDDAALSQQLKILRHQLLSGDVPLNTKLVDARDSQGDVGVNTLAPGQEKEKELPLVVVANARRVQESLRTIDELAKTQDMTPKLDPDKFKQARFSLYTIERELLAKLLRQDKAQRLSGLHAIIDTQALAGRSHVEAARRIIQGGATTIQLRDKPTSKRELLPIARQLRALCAERSVLFIVNDYLDLVLATDADGLHLGQNDLPIKIARKLLPIDKILGCSVTTVDQAVAAESDGADYVAVGSIYPTPTKGTAVIIGLEKLRQVRQAIKSPLVAIGGITKDNAAEVIAAGADSVAVISAILCAESAEVASREIAARIETEHE
ncbi:thiamine phosphate synthase [Chloroflexota bacterium]